MAVQLNLDKWYRVAITTPGTCPAQLPISPKYLGYDTSHTDTINTVTATNLTRPDHHVRNHGFDHKTSPYTYLETSTDR